MVDGQRCRPQRRAHRVGGVGAVVAGGGFAGPGADLGARPVHGPQQGGGPVEEDPAAAAAEDHERAGPGERGVGAQPPGDGRVELRAVQGLLGADAAGEPEAARCGVAVQLGQQRGPVGAPGVGLAGDAAAVGGGPDDVQAVGREFGEHHVGDAAGDQVGEDLLPARGVVRR